jgi:tetraacyldisaccharide 4'-kinase
MPSAPSFWHEPPGIAAGLLAPCAMAWDLAGRIRRAAARPYRAAGPVVCVGNIIAGGAGKTPVVISLAGLLAGAGAAVHVIARGYGGRIRGPVLVDPRRHDAGAVGDEPLLLAAAAPCWVGRDRAAAARAAIAAGADLLLLDDGFQNPGLDKTLSLLVIDAAYGLGNGRIIPAGPLRESLASALCRADAVVLIGDGPAAIDGRRPVMRATVEPVAGARLAGRRLFAFAGIARPERFFAMLQGLGVELVGARAFSDHHPFRVSEIERLRRDAELAGAGLITTAKDAARLPPSLRSRIEVLEIGIHWRDPAAPAALLAPLLGNRQDRVEAAG